MKSAIGLMRHRVGIQENQPAQNALYELVDSWSTVTTLWAQVTPLSGRSLQQAQQVHGEVSHRFRVRTSSTVIKPTRTRLSYDSRLFEVVAVIDQEERGRFTEILARERVAA